MAIRLDTVSSRSRLPVRRDPYFQRIAAGVFVGWRKMSATGGESWSVRLRDELTGKQHYRQLGTLEQWPDAVRFDKAREQAQEWAKHVQTGGVTAPTTVADACASYVQHKASEDARKRFAAYVLDDARFAGVELAKLTPAILTAWRQRLADRPTKAGGKRTAATLNRDITPFRAALNHAFEQGWVTSDFAWRAALKPIPSADGRRTLYLDREERRRLVAAAPPSLAPFLQTLCVLPVRPGALAALVVSDFDPRLNQLRIRVDKTGARAITLPANVAAIFASACRDKTPAAPIFARPDGKAWTKDAWKKRMSAVVAEAGLPADTVVYTLRHSAITDLVRGGLDLLTVAQLSGTSVRMIEAHYGQFRAEAATAALGALAL